MVEQGIRQSYYRYIDTGNKAYLKLIRLYTKTEKLPPDKLHILLRDLSKKYNGHLLPDKLANMKHVLKVFRIKGISIWDRMRLLS